MKRTDGTKMVDCPGRLSLAMTVVARAPVRSLPCATRIIQFSTVQRGAIARRGGWRGPVHSRRRTFHRCVAAAGASAGRIDRSAAKPIPR